MGKWVVITEEQLQELNEERKNTQNKRYDLRLHAVALRGEGMKCREIADKLDVTPQTVSVWCLAYSKEGLDGIKNGVFGQNHRNMSFQEEEELLATFKKQADKGTMVDTRDIRKAYETAVGHQIGNGQIYRVLKRHGWRKVMPRSRHPKKADEEAINSSKKLTKQS